MRCCEKKLCFANRHGKCAALIDVPEDDCAFFKTAEEDKAEKKENYKRLHNEKRFDLLNKYNLTEIF